MQINCCVRRRGQSSSLPPVRGITSLHRSGRARRDCEYDTAADDDLDDGVGELAAQKAPVKDEGFSALAHKPVQAQ